MGLPAALKVFAAAITLDQLAKNVVLQSRGPYYLNPGGAFSLLAGFGNYTTFALGILVALLAVGLWFNRQRKVSRAAKIGWALLLSGATSNTLDRVFRGGVIDFLQIGLLPNFNLADVAVVLGLVIISATVLTPFKAISR